MPTFRRLGAMALLSTVIATPAPAQEVIYEPGFCAFFYPNANCQNKGPGNPYTDPNYHRGTAQNGPVRPGGETAGVAGKKSRHHRSNLPATRMR
ncbi:MAG: hypothetical protein Q8M18_06780 [Bradyrhizobium sp.]|nr:hypothetical protein [Bradyrhizobium sp.]